MPLTSALFFPTLAREKILIFSQRQRKIGGGGRSETKKNKNKILIFIPRAPRAVYGKSCAKKRKMLTKFLNFFGIKKIVPLRFYNSILELNEFTTTATHIWR